MKNEIAQLLEAYNDLWKDVNSLLRDIEYMVSNKYKWIHYEFKKVESGCFYNSFYYGNNLLYTLIDLNDDIPYLQISLFHISDEEDEADEEVGLAYLEEHWKGTDPRLFLYDKNYEINKTKNGFNVISNNKEKYILSANIDLLSITSSDIVEKDINDLINALISGTYKEYCPQKIQFVESEFELKGAI